MGCVTAYCEDCLPQDEIESVGRCKMLEAVEYYSQQAYYVLCPACCLSRGVTATGVLGDKVKEEETEEGEEEEGEGVNGTGEGDSGLTDLPTQQMRLMWEEVPDSDDERQANKKKEQQKKEKESKTKGETPVSAKGIASSSKAKAVAVVGRSKAGVPSSSSGGSTATVTARKRGPQRKEEAVIESSDDSDESEEEEEENDEEEGYRVVVPLRCEPEQALQLLLGHPLAMRLVGRPLPADTTPAHGTNSAFAPPLVAIYFKLEAGKTEIDIERHTHTP